MLTTKCDCLKNSPSSLCKQIIHCSQPGLKNPETLTGQSAQPDDHEFLQLACSERHTAAGQFVQILMMSNDSATACTLSLNGKKEDTSVMHSKIRAGNKIKIKLANGQSLIS
jgi:hypothetical protein